LIVALDVDSKEKARSLIKELGESVSFYKVGYQLFIKEGLPFVSELVGRGKKVFLDLKLNDIGETLRLTVQTVADSGVHFLTLFGDGPAIRGAAQGRGIKPFPKLLNVTVLSTTDQEELNRQLQTTEIKLEDYVLNRARIALENGCDGVVASGESVSHLRTAFPKEKSIIVTPGVRPGGSSSDDHKRLLTPAQAIRAGSDYLVVGRPIRDSINPKETADRIVREIEDAWN
jgi:orotidine-5'-phosphate decarboxylase